MLITQQATRYQRDVIFDNDKEAQHEKTDSGRSDRAVQRTGTGATRRVPRSGRAAGSTQTTAQGGFSGPSAALTTVDKVKSLSDDTWVMLQGNIEQRIGDETYTFRDATGTLTVDIDRKRWNGQTVTPKDKVQLEGKVDKDWSSVEVDVKTVKKLP